MTPWYNIMKRLGLTEVTASKKAQITRSTWRAVTSNGEKIGLNSLVAVAKTLGLDLSLLLTPSEINTDFSTLGVSYKAMRDGPNSWKIHFMDFADEFRRTLDPRLILLPPSNELEPKLICLLASIVVSLCEEVEIDVPHWARRRFDLHQPWFVSEVESLKASALLESPLAFRRNNIFVLSNFLERL